MKRVVGLLENYGDAQKVIDDLTEEGLAREAIHVLRGEEAEREGLRGEPTAREDRGGMWERIKGFFGAETPESDVGYYTEGVRRNGVVIAADVPDGMADRAAEIMNDDGAVDIDKKPRSGGRADGPDIRARLLPAWKSQEPGRRPYPSRKKK